jgi:hypothetical protein
LKIPTGALVLHVNGGFHSNGRLGAPEQLLRYRTQARLMVVDIVSGDGFDEAEAKRTGRAGDFTIITNASVPRSFERKSGRINISTRTAFSVCTDDHFNLSQQHYRDEHSWFIYCSKLI